MSPSTQCYFCFYALTFFFVAILQGRILCKYIFLKEGLDKGTIQHKTSFGVKNPKKILNSKFQSCFLHVVKFLLYTTVLTDKLMDIGKTQLITTYGFSYILHNLIELNHP